MIRKVIQSQDRHRDFTFNNNNCNTSIYSYEKTAI